LVSNAPLSGHSLTTDSPDVAHQLVSLAAQGAFGQKEPDQGFIAREFAGLLEAHVGVRAQVYGLLADGPATQGRFGRYPA